MTEQAAPSAGSGSRGEREAGARGEPGAGDGAGDEPIAPERKVRHGAAAAGKPATIYDVAHAAGVSHQTVSRFLKGFAGIRPETRAKVERALAELDYRPNLTARSLTTGRSHRIGALTHDIDKYGPSKILGSAAAAARDAGYVLDIVTLDTTDAASIDEALAMIAEHDVEGVLALSSTDEMTHAFERIDFRVPAFVVTEPDEPSRVRSQLATEGMPALVAHLARLGHRRILFLAGPHHWSAARNRTRAIEAAAEALGLEVTGIIEGDWSAASGYAAIADLEDLDATAIVSANDQMALGAMLALSERGLAVPRDVSVTGIDDLPDAAFYTPPLTTLRMDLAGRGRAAFAELLSRIEGSAAHEPPAVQAELIVRQSTGPAPRRTPLDSQ
ncbi:LacI family DNA-binding transcriptional regulator [Demequina sp. SYSU T00192]|uniref:LacI family DNA-binding transcriptional regulator n=1 Tax=Demequina litoralis TaxID=3051660 RepID=A0ABT8GB26_9MICO|nr:LacI family DNA-binding transcriptional regulator [Demequina sp. SYSU T00192]MDN4476339.1 LacI family DNA-binding transcriptional regulator [Demequina sp. SYSU T00192]